VTKKKSVATLTPGRQRAHLAAGAPAGHGEDEDQDGEGRVLAHAQEGRHGQGVSVIKLAFFAVTSGPIL
jgi:hypothetical protein